MKFTDTQQKAIDLKGDSLLVSAAAGSGKTAVLTERVIQKITADPPTPIESLMILTFTTAAADEMRSRISKKLRERLADSPTDPVLRSQLSMLPSAQISTIHSACFSIVRENFEALGFLGLMLYKNGTLVAYSYGEPINRDTFCVHVEKADSEVRGAYQMINREFAREYCTDYKLINREDDAGDEGLRRAKLSYYPTQAGRKFRAIIK